MFSQGARDGRALLYHELTYGAYLLCCVQRQLFFPLPLPQEKMLPKKRCSESGHFSPDFTRLTSSRTLGEL